MGKLKSSFSALANSEEKLLVPGGQSGDFQKYYKWTVGDDLYCARVVNSTANYYKNGEVYAKYQQFILRSTDVEISETEFNLLLGL